MSAELFRVRAGKSVPRNFLAAFHAFEKERVPGALCDSKIGAHGCEQVRGKYVVNGDEVSLLSETLEFAKVRLNHGVRSQLTVSSSK